MFSSVLGQHEVGGPFGEKSDKESEPILHFHFHFTTFVAENNEIYNYINNMVCCGLDATGWKPYVIGPNAMVAWLCLGGKAFEAKLRNSFNFIFDRSDR